MAMKYNHNPYYTMTVLLEYISRLLKIAINVFYIYISYYAVIILTAFPDPLCSKYAGIIGGSLSLSLS